MKLFHLLCAYIFLCVSSLSASITLQKEIIRVLGARTNLSGKLLDLHIHRLINAHHLSINAYGRNLSTLVDRRGQKVALAQHNVSKKLISLLVTSSTLYLISQEEAAQANSSENILDLHEKKAKSTFPSSFKVYGRNLAILLDNTGQEVALNQHIVSRRLLSLLSAPSSLILTSQTLWQALKNKLRAC